MKDLDSNRTNKLFSEDELLAPLREKDLKEEEKKKERGYYCTEGNQKVLVGPPFKTYERTTS
jgi:hypothetical protein